MSTERPKRNLIGVGVDLKDFEVALDVAWNCHAISSDSNTVGVVERAETTLRRGRWSPMSPSNCSSAPRGYTKRMESPLDSEIVGSLPATLEKRIPIN